MKEWVSSKNFISPELSCNVEFPGTGSAVDINVSDLRPLIHYAGFRSLLISQQDTLLVENPKEDRYETIVDRAYRTTLFERNLPWPRLIIHLNTEAMRQHAEAATNSENNPYAGQLDSILKKALIGNGFIENIDAIGSGVDSAAITGQALWYWDTLSRFSQEESIAVMGTALLTLLSQFSLSKAVGGIFFGNAKRYGGAKESFFFGTKLDRLALMLLKGVTSTLAAPSNHVASRKG